MDFKLEIDTSGEQEAMEKVRKDLMTFITDSNEEFNQLLRDKAEQGMLEECKNETLQVLSTIKYNKAELFRHSTTHFLVIPGDLCG